MGERDSAVADTAMLGAKFAAPSSTSATATSAATKPAFPAAKTLAELSEVFTRVGTDPKVAKIFLGAVQRQAALSSEFASQKQQQQSEVLKQQQATAAQTARQNMSRIAAQASALSKHHGHKETVGRLHGVKRLNLHVKIPLITSRTVADQLRDGGSIHGLATVATIANQGVTVVSERAAPMGSRVFRLDPEKKYKLLYAELMSVQQGMSDMVVCMPQVQQLDQSVKGEITKDPYNSALIQNGTIIVPGCHSIRTKSWKEESHFLYMDHMLASVLKSAPLVGTHYADSDDESGSESDSDDDDDDDDNNRDPEEHARAKKEHKKREFLQKCKKFIEFWDQEYLHQNRLAFHQDKIVVFKCHPEDPRNDAFFHDVYDMARKLITYVELEEIRDKSPRRVRRVRAMLDERFSYENASRLASCYYYPLDALLTVVMWVREYLERHAAEGPHEIGSPKNSSQLTRADLSLPAQSCQGHLQDILRFACMPANAVHAIRDGGNDDAWDVWKGARPAHYANRKHDYMMIGTEVSHITMTVSVGLIEHVDYEKKLYAPLRHDLPPTALTLQQVQTKAQVEQWEAERKTDAQRAKEAADMARTRAEDANFNVDTGSDEDDEEADEDRAGQNRRMSAAAPREESDEDEDDSDSGSGSGSESESESVSE